MKQRMSKEEKYRRLLKDKTAHGGILKGVRKRKRPLSPQHSMHLVLRSSHARGPYSLLKHKVKIDSTLRRFSKKFSIQVLSYANVGNHLHLHLRLKKRTQYVAFIRALSASIMMLVTGFSRWKKKCTSFRFWDLRPFSRLVTTFRYAVCLKEYILINQWEGRGLERWQARHNVKVNRLRIE